MKRGIVTCVLALVALTRVLVQAQAPPLRQVTTVPFELMQAWPIPLMHLRVNDSIIGNFMFDTGCTVPYVSEDFAMELALTPKDSVGNNGLPVIFGGRTLQCVTIHKIDFGSLPGYDQWSPVLPGSGFTKLLEQRVDGVIAANYVREFAALVDYNRRVITLWVPGNLTQAEIAMAGMSGAVEVPARYDIQRQQVKVVARLNGSVDEELMVDTGSDVTRISSSVARQLKLKPSKRGLPVHTILGDVKTDRATLATVALGAAVWKDVDVTYASKETQAYMPVIGADILSKCAILFDLPNKKIYIKQEPAANDPGTAMPPAQSEKK